MKLRGVKIILLLLATTGFILGLVNSVCVVRDAVWRDSFWYQCSGLSSDYGFDVKRAPIDLERISFTNSNIPILKNSSFTRLGERLRLLVISNSNLTEIEDRAFQGLENLVFLDLSDNKLTSLKGVWFNDLQDVKYIYLKYNQISQVEDSFYTTLPGPKILDLSNNRLKCLSVSSMATFHIQGINLIENPLTWKCISALLDWENSNDIANINFGGLEVTQNVTKNCIAKSPTPADAEDEFINKCVEESLNELLPAEENYTIERLCEFLEDKPSSYLDCEN